MLSLKNVIGIFIYVNIAGWLLMLALYLLSSAGLTEIHLADSGATDFYLRGLLLNLFILSVFFYYNSRIEKLKNTTFIELLTSLFITGLVTNTLALVIYGAMALSTNYLEAHHQERWLNLLYHINIGLLIIFLTKAFFYWKRLIMHQKTQNLQRWWTVFEYALLISLLFNFFEFSFEDAPFILMLGALELLALKSFNFKWVVYLNAKEKWQSILLLSFITLFAIFFFQTVINYGEHNYLKTHLKHSVYVIAIFSFVILYTIISMLVMVFNLPTTSVFEKKLEEIISFQKLSQSLQAGDQEAQVYGILLDSAVSTASADAAWLEITDEEGTQVAFLHKGVEKEEIAKLKRVIKRHNTRRIIDATFARNQEHDPLMDELTEHGFKSMLSQKLVAHDHQLGNLTLLKKVKDGFDDDKKVLIKTFVRQASISIENYRLLARTIEAERYKEEIKIARNVQKSLLPLPKNLTVSKNLEIAAFSDSAQEVGGDYYDIYPIDKDRVMVIVGDVSGKGTTAAFNMAQMKGVFHSLAQFGLRTERFLYYANNALANCLDRASFITVTILLIDDSAQKIEFARAGHCPTLFYHHKDEEVKYYQGKGMGLGILRNKMFSDHIEMQTLHYEEGDMLLLYTDGIIEAMNKEKEEYGYERLQDLILSNAHLSPAEINDKIITDLNHFSRGMPVHDDHTALMIKFKHKEKEADDDTSASE
ncbi:MAG TPA: hypothetical protein DCS93_32780 [Microscillaceae bacterium]|nr:hypothetical protein [Microscillaceae bacterium]